MRAFQKYIYTPKYKLPIKSSNAIIFYYLDKEITQ